MATSGYIITGQIHLFGYLTFYSKIQNNIFDENILVVCVLRSPTAILARSTLPQPSPTIFPKCLYTQMVWSQGFISPRPNLDDKLEINHNGNPFYEDSLLSF